MTPEEIEAVAERVADLVAERTDAPRICTAAELAAYLQVSPDLVYSNAARLGAIRLGDGPRARLRFALDGEHVRSWIERSHPTETPPTPVRKSRRPRRARPAVDLLPIAGETQPAPTRDKGSKR